MNGSKSKDYSPKCIASSNMAPLFKLIKNFREMIFQHDGCSKDWFWKIFRKSIDRSSSHLFLCKASSLVWGLCEQYSCHGEILLQCKYLSQFLQPLKHEKNYFSSQLLTWKVFIYTEIFNRISPLSLKAVRSCILLNSSPPSMLKKVLHKFRQDRWE